MVANQRLAETCPSGRESRSFGYKIAVDAAGTHGRLVDQFLKGETPRAFLDISPTSSAANSGRLEAVIGWIIERVPRLTVVEGSYLARWDLMGLDGYSEEDASRVALQRAQKTERRIRRVINGLSEGHKVEFLDWRMILCDARFKAVNSAIRAFSKESLPFAKAIRLTAEDFLRKMSRNRRITNFEAAEFFLQQYVLEEVAGFIHLCGNEENYVEVYPGQDLSIMELISTGYFEGFPFPVPQRTHISITVSPYASRPSK